MEAQKVIFLESLAQHEVPPGYELVLTTPLTEYPIRDEPVYQYLKGRFNTDENAVLLIRPEQKAEEVNG